MEEQKNTITDKWRPMMGWTYMATCLFDFIIGPVVYNVLQFLNPGQHIDMWQAVTLQGGGLYHLSMGAILGISAYGRTQEKINGVVNPPATPVPMAMASAPMAMASAPMAPVATAYSTPEVPVTTAPVYVAPGPVVNTAFGSGPAPQVDEPL